MKRIVSIILALTLICCMIPTAFAASSEATEAADALNALGLFNGTGTDANGNPIYDLDRAPTREEAVTMLVRLLGKESEAKAGTWKTPFTDVQDWAKPYVSYAYANKLTSGTSATTFDGSSVMTATQYITLVLRALGYESGTDFQWDKAWELSDKIGMTDGRYSAEGNTFLRGDVAIISNAALSTDMKNSNTSLKETLNIDTAPAEINQNTIQGIWYEKTEATTYYPYVDETIYIFSGNTYIEATYSPDHDWTTIVNGKKNVTTYDFLYYAEGTYSISDGKITLQGTSEVVNSQGYSTGNKGTKSYDLCNFAGTHMSIGGSLYKKTSDSSLVDFVKQELSTYSGQTNNKDKITDKINECRQAFLDTNDLLSKAMSAAKSSDNVTGASYVIQAYPYITKARIAADLAATQCGTDTKYANVKYYMQLTSDLLQDVDSDVPMRTITESNYVFKTNSILTDLNLAANMLSSAISAFNSI